MKKEQFITVETSFPNLESAKNLAKILLQKNLVACIHLQKVESLFFWEGRLENEQEILLSAKTISVNFSKIEEIIKNKHSYKLPQIIAKPITHASKDYLSWIETNLSAKTK
jgi:periplasmic divalent cation tolerance protein